MPRAQLAVYCVSKWHSWWLLNPKASDSQAPARTNPQQMMAKTCSTPPSSIKILLVFLKCYVSGAGIPLPEAFKHSFFKIFKEGSWNLWRRRHIGNTFELVPDSQVSLNEITILVVKSTWNPDYELKPYLMLFVFFSHSLQSTSSSTQIQVMYDKHTFLQVGRLVSRVLLQG